jgi:hypothetical protein
MRSDSRGVRIASIAEDAEVVVGWGVVVQGEVGSGKAHRRQRKAVEEVGGGVQGLCLVAGRERRLKEKATYHISGGADHALGPSVLSGGVGAQEA